MSSLMRWMNLLKTKCGSTGRANTTESYKASASHCGSRTIRPADIPGQFRGVLGASPKRPLGRLGLTNLRDC